MVEGTLGRKELFRTYPSLTISLFKLFDLSLLVSLGLLSYYLLLHHLPSATLPKVHLILSIFLYTIIASKTGLYANTTTSLSSDIVILGLVGVFLVMTLSIAGEIVEGADGQMQSNAKWLALWIALVIAAQILYRRLIARPLLKLIRRRGFNQRRVVLVGTNHKAESLIDDVTNHPEYGLAIVGYIDDAEPVHAGPMQRLPYLGPTANVLEICNDLDIKQVWLNYPLEEAHRSVALLQKMKHSTVSIRHLLNFAIFNQHASFTRLCDFPLLDIDVSPMEGTGNRLIKEVEDRVVAGLLLCFLSPLLLLLAISVKFSSAGPVFYRQTRISWNNKPFVILKFRTMPVDVEKGTGPKWATAGERRATKFGAFLRSTSADELPQLINVLKGDMSLVGPRPERPEFVEQFKEIIPNYMKKHMVKAGITGWAQVEGHRGDSDLKKRIECDLYYIKNWTPLFDLQIAFQTLYKGIFNKNAY